MELLRRSIIRTTNRMQSFDRSNPLFDERVPVLIRHPELDERHVDLTIRVLKGSEVKSSGSTASSANSCEQNVLRIEITDDPNDPFFLHILQVSEGEFHRLKQDQTLLVDFHSFPIHFMELLRYCLPSSEKPVQNYITILETGLQSTSSNLRIVETNRFKQLTHLSLKMEIGNDSAIKQYLADRLRQTLVQSTSVSLELERLSSLLESEEQRSANQEIEIQRLNQSRQTELSELSTSHQRVMAEQKEKNVAAIDDLQQKRNQDIQDIRMKYDSELETLRQKLTDSDEKVCSLTKSNFSLESEVKNLTKMLEESTTELAGKEKKLENVGEKLRTAEESLFENNKEKNKLELRVAVLEQQIKDNEEVVAKTSSLLTASESRNKELQESLKMYKTNHSALQVKLEQSVEEINKGNRLIEKIHSENRNLKSKLNTKGKIIKQQEKIIEDKQNQMNEMRLRYEGSSEKLESTKSEVGMLKENLKAANNKLDESNKLLASNQQVIAWLNKEINKVHLDGGSRPLSNHNANIGNMIR